MKHLVKNLAVTATLAGTAFLLVADSARECPHPEQDVSFAVSGDCGPSGTVRIQSPTDSCDLTVENAQAVNLPGSGDFMHNQYDLRQGGWGVREHRTLTVSDGNGGTSEVSGMRECQADLVEGTLELSCDDTRLDVSPTVEVATCKAVLTAQ